MSYTVNPARVCVVTVDGNSISTQSFPSSLAAVLGALDCGTLGEDGCHGSLAHVAALGLVIERACKIIVDAEKAGCESDAD